MRLQRYKSAICLGLCAAMVCSSIGCHSTPQVADLAYFGNQPLQHYEDAATEIAYATEACDLPENPDFGIGPREIFDRSDEPIWDMSLGEVIQIALKNGAIIKDDGSFGSPANPLLTNPNGVRTAYDVAILDTGILFGNRGVEAALADFDAQITATMTWGRDERIQNTPFFSLGPGSVLAEETGNGSVQVQKQFANSGSFTLSHQVQYSGNNVGSSTTNTGRQFLSEYSGRTQAEYRQPMMAGSGTLFTQVAGPISSNLQGVSGVSQGVLISRINSDIAIADFESSLAGMVRDVENRYRDLHLFYLLYDVERVAAWNALYYWKRLEKRKDTAPETLSQAASGYHDAIRRVKNSLADVYENEARLRRLMGLPPRDAKGIIRPTDDMVAPNVMYDWHVSLAEAFSRRPRLRSQKWNIKRLELQLQAARSLVRPRFDFVAQYRINQFGDQLFGRGDSTSGSGIINDSFYESLTTNKTTGWNIGLQYSKPFGFRAANSQVRNQEFQLRKARAVLAGQEMEIVHELDASFRSLNRWKTTLSTDLEAMEHGRRYLELAIFSWREDSGRDEGTALLNRLLQAHAQFREAQVNYYRDLTEYNKTLVELNFRKGSLLGDNNVHLSEGDWCPSAYDDALRRAWSRSYAIDTNKLQSEAEFVAPPPMHPTSEPQLDSDQRSPFIGAAEAEGDADPKPDEPDEGKPPTPSPVEGSGSATRDEFRAPLQGNRGTFSQPQVRQVTYQQPVSPARVAPQRSVRPANGIADQLRLLEQQARRTGDSK